MNTCESCQSQLLHHLYGLLDEPAQAELLAHVGQCPTCAAALETARQQQRILAAAAKSEFPEVRFDAVPQQGVEGASATLPLPKRRSWVRWAVAACLLLAIGVGGYAGFSSYTYKHARTQLDFAKKESEKLYEQQYQDYLAVQSEIDKLQKTINKVEIEYRDQVVRTQREIAQRQPVEVTVNYPKSLQAGGVNEITIQAKRNTLPAEGSRMIAMVVDDKSKAEVARMLLKEGKNDFVLPASLSLKPGTQLNLRVLVTKGEQAEQSTVFDETLPLVTSIYVTHLTTDRPMYRPGEVVYFRSLTLERFSLKPATEPFELHYRLVRSMGGQDQEVAVLNSETGSQAQLVGSSLLKLPSGAVLGPDGKEITGIGAGSFRLPEDLPGGEYTLVVSEAFERFPAERRRIMVNRYQAPRLNKDVDFTRKSYGAGDLVTAICKVAPVEGGRVLAQMPVTVSATVDGTPCEIDNSNSLKTDALGQCIVQFRLPAKIERGEGVLTVGFTDGANLETTVEPIPIVVNKLQVEVFPEGGELVAGTVNRVYVQARTPLNKPAEMHGRIVDNDDNTVVVIKTFSDDKEVGVNQGMGSFDFTPQPGQRYRLKIDSPVGIDATFSLPPVQTSAVLLHLERGVVNDEIGVKLFSAGRDRQLLVGAYCRGRLLDYQTVTALAGQPIAVTLKPEADVAGVCRVTVFEISDENGATRQPLAERLLYRRSNERLNLQLFTDKKSYTPGERVTLSLKATDEHNKPAPAIVLVSVVDKSILKLRNDRTARAMPTHFLLTSEVRGPEDLEYADVLLRDDSQQCETALDLLLGTQGWRRFIEQKLPAQRGPAAAVYQNDLKRFLAINGLTPTEQGPAPLVSSDVTAAVRTTVLKHEKLEKELAGKEAVQEAKLREAKRQRDQVDSDVATNEARLHTADTRLQTLSSMSKSFGPLAIGGVFLLFIFLTFIGLDKAASRRPHAKLYLVPGLVGFAIMVACGLLFLETDWRSPRIRQAAQGPKEDVAQIERAAQVRERNEPKLQPPAPPLAPAVWQQAAPLRKPAMAAAPRGGKLAGDFLMPVDPAYRIEPQHLVVHEDVKGMFEGKRAVDEELAVPLPEKMRLRLHQADRLGADWIEGGEWANEPPPPPPPPPAKLMMRINMSDPERQLRKAGKFGQITMSHLNLGGKSVDNRDMRRVLMNLQNADAFIVRQYAHQHTASPDNVRRDFAETVYWHPALVLPGDKALDVSFDLSDAVTQFQVQVWGHTLDGRLAAVSKDIESRLPFSLDAKLPIEISSTDKIAIPVALTNDTEKNRHVQLKVEADNLKLLDPAEQMLPLDANSRLRKVLHLQPATVQGEAKLRLLAQCEPFGADSVERAFKIVPEGFPVADKHSGLLEKIDAHTVKLPARRDQWVPGTLKLYAQVFPSTLADLQKGLEALLREPGGCFEQTSSSNYPNVMILDYLKESGQIQPQLEKRALALLDNGYNKLIAFECIDPATRAKKEGYEWFGQTAPPHEALTAYGLVQFLDMAKYQKVDPAMIERTKKYLLGQRDGKGGFRRNPRSVDSFGHAPDEITNAYIVWAFSEAGVKDDIAAELSAVVARANDSKDPYTLALAGLGLLNCGQNAKASDLLKTLKIKQKDDGSLTGSQTSITGSGGAQLSIETTSLALLAWLRANQPQEYSESVRKAADWIGKQRGAFGGYGSTQSTILALKALIAYTKENKKTAEAGELRLYLGDSDKPAAVRAFPAGTLDPVIVELTDDKLLEPGDNKVRVEITGKNQFPYTLSWSYMALTPANKDVCPVRLSTTMAAAKATEGDVLRVTAQLDNVSGKEQGMAIAIIGLPGGCILPPDLQELRKLVKEGTIDAFEIRGRDLVLYWRGLAKDAKHVVNFNIICQIPGHYRGPASRAYLYYNTDERWWVEPLGVEIAAK